MPTIRFRHPNNNKAAITTDMPSQLQSAVGLVVLLLLAAMTAKAFGTAMTGWMKSIDTFWTPAAAGGLR